MERSFFNMPEYENRRNWSLMLKVGKSSSNEANRNINIHKKPFRPIKEGERDMAFKRISQD